MPLAPKPNILAALTVVLVLAGHAAIAQQQPAAAAAPQPIPVVVGILDEQEIMRSSKAGKALKAELDKQNAAFRAEIAQQESTLRAAAEQLQAQQASLSPEAFQKKRQELDAQVETYRKNAQARKDQLDRAFAAGVKQMRDALGKVASEIAQARGMTLVLDRSQVVLSHNGFDITAEALKRFDQRLPSVSLPK